MLKSLSFIFIIFLLVACGQDKTQIQTKEKNQMEDKTKNEQEFNYVTISDDSILVAVVKTNMGTFEMQLFPKETPKTVTNFVTLAKEGFYDGVTFHRVIDGFMIQGGDPTGTGTAGKSIYGKPFEDEFSPDLRHDSAGVVSMANRGPNTNTSQFFITLSPQPHLNGRHTVFGKIIKGMDVVRAIGKVKTAPPYDKPVEPVIMEKVQIERRKK